jgi:hypothetical protein
MLKAVGAAQVGDSHKKVLFNLLTMSYPRGKPKRWDSSGAGYLFAGKKVSGPFFVGSAEF